jgi:hypothetical protein
MSAPGLPVWVPLRQLRSKAVEAYGEAGADAAMTTIMAGIDDRVIPVRWSGDLRTWRTEQRVLGRAVQQPTGIHTHGLLTQIISDRGRYTFDELEGIALVTGDPHGQGKPGPWPVGPVDVAWHIALALLDKAAQTKRGAA